MHIHILTTGGTFDKIYHDALSEFTIGEPMADALLREAGVNLPYSVDCVLKKDSLDFPDDDSVRLHEARSLYTLLLIKPWSLLAQCNPHVCATLTRPLI